MEEYYDGKNSNRVVNTSNDDVECKTIDYEKKFGVKFGSTYFKMPLFV